MRNIKKYNALDFKTKLKKHKQWVKSGGRVGSQLSLDEMDLTEKYDENFLIEQSFITACNFSSVVFEKTDFFLADPSTQAYSCRGNSSFLGLEIFDTQTQMDLNFFLDSSPCLPLGSILKYSSFFCAIT